MRSKRSGEICSKLRCEQPDGSGRPAVHGRVDKDQRIVIVEKGKKVKPPSPTVYKFDPLGKSFRFQPTRGVNSHSLIPHQIIPDAEDQCGLCLKAPTFGFSREGVHPSGDAPARAR